jgi:glycine/serine hydroxymethyltransferase
MLYALEFVRDSIFLLCECKSAKKKLTQILAGGCNVVSGGTDSHLILVDLRPKKITGNIAEKSLERAGITCNKNAIPFDPEKPMVTSGIRLGTPTLTSRGMGTGTQFAGFTSTNVQLILLALLAQKY